MANALLSNERMIGETGHACDAADSKFDIKTPITLAKDFGASNYASAREFSRIHHRACVVYILGAD